MKSKSFSAYLLLLALLIFLSGTESGCAKKKCAAYGGSIDRVKVGKRHKPQTGLFDKKMKR